MTDRKHYPGPYPREPGGDDPPLPAPGGRRDRPRPRRILTDDPPPRSRGETLLRWWGIASLGGILLLAALLVAGYLLYQDEVHDLRRLLEAQAHAVDASRELSLRHRFTPPPDGEVPTERAAVFIDVTREAWADAEPILSEPVRPGGAAGEGGGEVLSRNSVVSAWNGARLVAAARIRLLEALERHDMPVEEYRWIAETLLDGAEVGADPGEPGEGG